MKNQNSEVLTCYFEEAAKKGKSSCFWGAIFEGGVKGSRKHFFLSFVELLNVFKLSAGITLFKTEIQYIYI